MATSFAQYPTPLHSPPYLNQQPIYNINSAQSTPSSTNVSPTNHTSHLYARQMRQPKVPLYIPAVLRPTELHGSRQVSLTPPRSAHNSMDSTRENLKIGVIGSLPASPEDDDDCSFAPWGQGSMSRVVSDEWNDETLGNVTGAPTRNHWKPDASAELCTSPTCSRSFSFFSRRHHCRRCGNIFCSSHTPHAVPLDQEARFHPEGTFQRSCDTCYADYRTWRRSRNSRNNSVISKGSDETACAQPLGVPGQHGDGETGQQHVGSVAQSVGGAWNWSTF